MLTEEQMKQMDAEVAQRSMGINPDTMPVREEADNYAFTPEATIPEMPMPETYTAPDAPEPSIDMQDNLDYISGMSQQESLQMAAPIGEMAGRFANDVKKTNIYKRYAYSKEDVLREARDISIETGIPESAILYSPQTLDNARNVYNYRRKQMEVMPPGTNEVSMDLLTKAYPGLDKIINNGSEVDAAIALHNIQNVKQVNSLVEAARTGWQSGMLRHEMDKIGSKAFMEGRGVTDKEFEAYDKIQKQIEDLRQTPSFIEDPLLSIVGGTAEQVPQQGRGLLTGVLYGTAAAATAAGATVAVAPVTGGASLAGAGAAARWGWGIGMRLGYAVDMWEHSAGGRYIEYSRFKDKDGKRVLTDAEARAYAAAAAAVETGIEFMNAGKILDVLQGNKSAAARQIRDAVAGATDNATFTAALKRVLSGVGEIAVSESLEEGGQEAADRMMSNFVASYKGGNIPKYTPGQVLQGAVESFAEALPASIGFGLSAAGGGTIGLVRKAAAYSELQDLHVRERLKNVTGIHMVQNMIQDAGVKDFFRKDKDIAKQVLRDTVEGTGYEKVNIDTQMVLEQEGGLDALQTVAEAAGMSADEVQKAVETGADITVPTEVYFQVRSENENFAINENLISFSDTAPCFARNQYYAKMVKSELDTVMRDVNTTQMEQQQAALDMIVQGNFAEGLEQDAAAAILTVRPDNPAEGWKEMRGMYQQRLDDILAPVIRELKSGMKQGVDVVRVEGERDASYIRHSNNAEWARKWYAENKRWPNQAELESIAIDILSGRDFSKLADYQNRPEMEDFYEQNAAEIDEILQNIDVFDAIRDRIEAIDADELQTMEGMSREAYDVYRNVAQQLAASAPNDAVKRSAKAGAALLARRADRFAEAMREAGNANYTATDYFRDRFGLRVGGTFQGGGSNALFQVPAAEFNRQKAEVRAQYENTDGWMKAPNGSDTNLTEDQWITVRTSAFKNWFGDWENDPANASKILDENGEPLVVYHGTNKKFDTFSKKKTLTPQFWFTDRKDLIESGNIGAYGRGIIMPVFLSIKNPAGWHEEDNFGLDQIKARGFDGKDLTEEGKGIYVAFEPNQIKDATGRNVGFDPASNNIYYQTSTQIAAKYPNWMDNQVVADEDSKKGQTTQIAGTVKTYEKVGNFIKSKLPKEAKILDASSGMGLGTLALRGMGIEVEDIEPYPGGDRMKTNPPTFYGVDAYEQARRSGKQYDYIISNAVLNVIPDDWRQSVLHDMASLLKVGGQMFINVRKKGEEKNIKNKFELDSPQEVLVGTPERIVSYQRFFTPKELADYVKSELGAAYEVTIANESNSGTKGLPAVVVTKKYNAPDTYYQQTAATYFQEAMPERDLVAYHNMSENSVLRSAALGGLPVPSIAVTRQDIPFDQFGEITLIGGSDIVDPANNSANEIFSRDAWTVTFPKTVYDKIKTKDVNNLLNTFKSSFNALGDEGRREASELDYILNGDPSIDNAKHNLSKQLAVMYHYVTQVLGKPVKVPFEKVKGRYDYLLKHKEISDMVKEMRYDYFQNDEMKARFSNAVRPYIEAEMKKEHGEDAAKYVKVFFTEEGYFSRNLFDNLTYELRDYGKTKLNERKLKAELKKKIKEADYEKFIDEQISTLFKNPQIMVGKKRMPITLDNIVAAMSALRGAGKQESLTYGDNKALAAMSKKFKSLAELRKKKANLTTQEKANLAVQTYKEKADEYREVVGSHYKWNDSWDKWDDANKALVMAAKNGGSESAIRTALLRNDFENIDDAVIEAAKEVINAAKDMQTDYFEAKPLRAVGFNEFAAAVVPNGTSKETIDFLKSQGIAVTKYNPNVEGDRQAKTQKAAQKANVYFQRQQRQGDTIQGATEFQDDGRRIVSIFESGNESTMAHELGHIFVADLKELAEMPNAPEQIKKDWQTIKDWLGYKDSQKTFTTPQQEKFARGFEAYLRTGEAPATGLRKIFRQFKNWLTKIYKDFLSLGGKPSAEVQAVMGRMLATEQEVENAFKLRETETFEKAGGFDYLAKDSAEMYKRWQEEAQAYAKEKVLAQAMKDLTAERSNTLAALRDQMESDIREQMQEQPLYIAEAALTQNPKLAKDWPAEALGMTYEEYTQAIAEQGSLESAVKAAVDAGMQEVEEGMPVSEIKQAAKEAVDSSEYRGLYLAFEQDFIDKKMRRDEALTNRIEKALDDLEKEAYEANIDTVDPDGKIRSQEPKADNAVKRRIRELKYQARWNEAEMKAMNKLERAEGKRELQQAIREFKAVLNRTRRNVKIYRDTAVEKHKIIKQYAAENMAEMPISEATNVTKWQSLEKRAGRESIEAMKRAIDAELRYKQEESGLVPVDSTAGRAEGISSGTQVATTEQLPAKRRTPMSREQVSALWQQANEAKLRQRVFAEYAALAQKNKEFIRKKNARLQARQKTIQKNNNIPANERYMYLHGLYVLGLANQDAQMPQNAQSLMKMVQGYKENLQAFFVDEDGNISMPDYALSAMTGNTVYKDGYSGLTMEQYEYFNDMLTAIYKAGLDANKVKAMKDIDGNTVLISDVAEAIANETSARVPLLNNPDITNAGSPTFAQSIQNKARRARVELTKAETVLDMMGPTAYRYIYETVNQSWNKERVMLEQSAAIMKSIWEPYSNTEKSEMRSKKQYRFGTSILTKEEMICVAFNWGTEINRKRVMDGFGVDEMTVNELLSNLTQKDWQMVTSVWDLVNSYWPETVRVEESMTGVAPKKQSAMPFQITGKDGNVYTLQGGYYPIKYDPSKSLKAANQAQDDAAKQFAANNAAMNRNRSFTKQRVQGTVARPLMLSFNVLNRHISDVVHNICFRESLRDVNRIIKSPEVSQAIQERFGIDQARALEQWVRDCWAPDVAKKDVFASSMEFFRHKQTAAALGYRMVTAALNALNIYPMTDYLGATRTMEALGKFYSDPKANWDFALERSIFLRERAETMDRDAGEVLRKEFVGGYGKVADTLIRGEQALERHAFDALAVTDLMLACPLWTAEYQRVYQERTAELKGKMDADAWSRIEMEAVAAGDKAVRTVFGSGEMKDLSPVQKGGEMTKAVTMFYSYFNVVFNALYSGYGEGRREAMRTGSTFNVAPLAKKMLYWIVLTGVTEGVLRSAIDAITGNGGDEPEDWMKAMFKGVSDNIAGTIPVFRDIWSGVIDKLMGERYYGARPLPVYTVYDNVMKLSNTISNDKKSKIDVFREGMRIVNGMTGVGNAVTDAMATTAYWVDTDFDRPLFEYLAAVFFDQRIDRKKKK